MRGQKCVPKSGYGRGAPPIMGIDSRRLAPMGVGGKPGPRGLPLLLRFSMARSTSVVTGQHCLAYACDGACHCHVGSHWL